LSLIVFPQYVLPIFVLRFYVSHIVWLELSDPFEQLKRGCIYFSS